MAMTEYADKQRLFGHKAGVHDDQKPNRKRERRDTKVQLRKEWKR